MNTKDYMIANTLKERLSEVVSVVDLIVYGSRARGDYDEYSDMDVLVEVETLTKDNKDMIYQIAWEVGFENLMVISALIVTKDELTDSALASAPIVKNVLEGGVRV